MVSQRNQGYTIASCTTHTTELQRKATDTFFVYHDTSTIPTEEVSDHIDIAAEQASDNMLARIFKTPQVVDSGKACTLITMIDPSDHQAETY